MKKMMTAFVCVVVCLGALVYVSLEKAALDPGTLVAEAKASFSTLSQDEEKTPLFQESKKKDVIDLISHHPSYSKFAEALRVTGLAELLKGEKRLTIFVPSDEILAMRKDKAAELILRPQNTNALKELLLSHVVQDYILESQLLDRTLKTLDGKILQVIARGGKALDSEGGESEYFTEDLQESSSVRNVLFYEPSAKHKQRKIIQVQGLNLLKVDIKGDNGVIHEIDGIILVYYSSHNRERRSDATRLSGDQLPDLAASRD